MTHQSEQQNNIQDSFNSTLIDPNLQNLSINLAEVGIDSILNDGLLKEIPIVSTISNLLKIGANIHDRLFLEKVLSFLSQLKDVSADKRKKVIEDIDNSKKFRIKVGKKLLYIIDTCEDYEMTELVSIVFKAYIEEKITYNEFLKTASVLQNINKIDFDWFTKNREKHYFDLNEVGDLMHTGLFELYYEQISVNVENETDRKVLEEANGSKYRSDVDGGVSVNLTRAGEILLEVFCPTYKNPKTIKI